MATRSELTTPFTRRIVDRGGDYQLRSSPYFGLGLTIECKSVLSSQTLVRFINRGVIGDQQEEF